MHLTQQPIPPLHHTKQSYSELRSAAFTCLQQIGGLFSALAPSAQAVAGECGAAKWSARRVECGSVTNAVTGTGYLNTFQDDAVSDASARAAAFEKRRALFTSAGGSWSDVILLQKVGPYDSSWNNIVAGEWYDYVVSADLSIRCYPCANQAEGEKKPYCGHTLLTKDNSTDGTFVDEAVVMAGEMLCVKSLDGKVQALIISNNSGHFKPLGMDLINVLPAFVRTGVAEEDICLFSGPNNILAWRRLLTGGGARVGHAKASDVDLRNPYAMVESWEGI